MNENTTEAVDLARIILDDSEGYPAGWLCTLTAHEARTLAHAALAADRVDALADWLETEGTAGVRVPNRTPHDSGWHDSQIIAAARIRAALKGGDA